MAILIANAGKARIISPIKQSADAYISSTLVSAVQSCCAEPHHPVPRAVLQQKRDPKTADSDPSMLQTFERGALSFNPITPRDAAKDRDQNRRVLLNQLLNKSIGANGTCALIRWVME